MPFLAVFIEWKGCWYWRIIITETPFVLISTSMYDNIHRHHMLLLFGTIRFYFVVVVDKD